MAMAASFILVLCISGMFPALLASPADIVKKATYEKIFPNRNAFYTYESFISAAGAFNNFGNTGSAEVQKRELAAFFAHVKQETGGLQYIEEIDKSSNYCDSRYPCPAGKKYYGRGPLQLSWNYNYQAAGKALGLDLINKPELLATNAVDSFKAALWFWMQGRNPSCHAVISGTWTPSAADRAANRLPGFGATTNLINGAIECGKGSETPQSKNRVSYYKQICSTLGADPGQNLNCANMKSFVTSLRQQYPKQREISVGIEAIVGI